MAESERRRLISSTPHLSPDDIVQRAFTTSFRGYTEAEVRGFLKRISDELVVTRDREAELLIAIDSLEEQVRKPRPLNEPEMLDALGAETTRLLRSAREAADEIRSKAQERAAQLIEEARAVAERIGSEAEEFSRSRTDEAVAHAAALVDDAETRAEEARLAMNTSSEEERQRAEREAAELIESARQQGREMLDEAKATRERVLADLLRRRTLLQAQIEELRGGRDNLLDAYRVVKRTFLEATGALAQVEARAAADRAAGHVPESDGDQPEASTDSNEIDSNAIDSNAIDSNATGTGTVVDSQSGGPDVPGSGSATEAGESTDPTLADVDSLFARIRAGHTDAAIEPPAAVGAADPVDPADAVQQPPTPPADAAGVDASPTGVGDGAATNGAPDPDPTRESDTAPAEVSNTLDAWRSLRSEVLDPLLITVAKRAKRAAQDDQNALLDAVRRHKGRPTSAQVLVAESDVLAAWVDVLRPATDEAYGAGRAAAGGEPVHADDTLARDAAATIVLPVRERIATAIDSGEEGDMGGLVERIGARFREWKNQSLEEALFDALTVAWSRGVYDASPDGAVLRWIPVTEGRCADCDDNGLEPTVKGSSFPTGQLHPPAHPGCRCLLAPADILSRLAASA
ncbi:MAG: DivIVA domain-containing protein [Acidimicrobiia bacterium]